MSLSKSGIILLSLCFLSPAFSFAATLLPNLLAGTGLISPVEASLVLALTSLLSGIWQPVMGRWLNEGRFRFAPVSISIITPAGCSLNMRLSVNLRID